MHLLLLHTGDKAAPETGCKKRDPSFSLFLHLSSSPPLPLEILTPENSVLEPQHGSWLSTILHFDRVEFIRFDYSNFFFNCFLNSRERFVVWLVRFDLRKSVNLYWIEKSMIWICEKFHVWLFILNFGSKCN